MNFEEMLEQKRGHGASGQKTLFGVLGKVRTSEGKFVNSIEIRRELSDASGFAKAFDDEAARSRELLHKQLLPFEVFTTDNGMLAARIGQGSITTVGQLISDNPAVVVSKDFCKNMIEGLLRVAAFLHEKGVHHLCFSPDNVFVRRYTDTPLLIFHGSSYYNMNQRELLWKDHEHYVAPEVLEGSAVTAASDIYSVGRFIEYLYTTSSVPYELTAIVRKATAANAVDRYQSADEMLTDISRRRGKWRIMLSAAAAVLVLLAGWGIYSSLTPAHTEMEYVEPQPKEDADTFLSKGFDEKMELQFLGDTSRIDGDAAPGELSPSQERVYREHQAKAEDIFRRQYTKQAERILSRLYGKSRTTMTESDFVKMSSTVTDELVKAQQQLTEMTGLSPARGQLLASNIIDQVTNRYDADLRRRQQLEEQQRINSQKKKAEEADETARTTAAPGSKDTERKSRGVIDQRKALEVEEELRDLEH